MRKRTKDKRIDLRLSASERERVLLLAQIEGKTVSQLIRQILLAYFEIAAGQVRDEQSS